MRKFNVAVVGATGAVGEELFRVLEEYDFPINKLIPIASSRSAGSKVEYKNREITVLELTETCFEENDIEIAFFSAGGSVSEKFAKFAVEAGAVVIDNTSHFRMDPKVPLVVPEVNPEDIKLWKESGIIANPNCSTIQMVLSLKPLDELYGIKRVDVSTYQAVSGAGKTGMEELVRQMQDFFAFKLDETEIKAFPHQIALNVIPQIDVATENGFTNGNSILIEGVPPAGGDTGDLSTQSGQSNNLLPVITAVSPNTGNVNGGTTVLITGNNFTDVASVKFGAINGTNVNVVSPFQLTVIAPPSSILGAVNVSVITAFGSAVRPGSFTYQ